jgi:hypothetical protein
MRLWRNWYTRTFEGRVSYLIWVQVPSAAPKLRLSRSRKLRLRRSFIVNLRVWRNWQTRKIQVLMGASLCRFKSCHPHHNFPGPSMVECRVQGIKELIAMHRLFVFIGAAAYQSRNLRHIQKSIGPHKQLIPSRIPLNLSVKAMTVYGYEFRYLQQLMPECDANGKIIKYYPQGEYDNKKDLPLSYHGKGPFCRFPSKLVSGRVFICGWSITILFT